MYCFPCFGVSKALLFLGDLVNGIRWINQAAPQWLQLQKHERGFLVNVTRKVSFQEVCRQISHFATGEADDGSSTQRETRDAEMQN